MEIVIPIESACWRALACSEAPASLCASAASYCLPKDVGVPAIVETELKLREIQGQIFLAHVMIGADDSPLEPAPEIFQVISVHLAAHVFASAVRHKFVLVALSVQVAIARMFIGRDQIHFVANRFADEPIISAAAVRSRGIQLTAGRAPDGFSRRLRSRCRA